MNNPESPNSRAHPARLFSLLVIWAAASAILRLATDSEWWLSVVGGAGVVALVLSFTLSDKEGSAESESSANPPAD